VCDFSVATTERRKDKAGDLQEITTWFRVTLFGRQAELAAQYLTKGQQVYVEGALSQREYTDKDGVTRTSLDVRGTEIRFLSSASEGEQLRAAAANAAAPEPKRQPAPQPTVGCTGVAAATFWSAVTSHRFQFIDGKAATR
jgi:single-strand DNA-binding protein